MDNEIILSEGITEETPEFNFATIGEVCADGVTLIFDGQTEATEKHYRCNTAVPFSAGDRVKICKDSGTYVVEYIVGSPRADVLPNYIPGGGSDGQILTKDGATNYSLEWTTPTTPTNYIPGGGSDGQILTKNGTTDYNLKWGTAVQGLPSGGSTGQILAKNSATAYDASWTTPSNYIPSGGTNNQILLKDGSGNYSLKWGNYIPTGGTTGQVLTKSAAGDWAMSWTTPDSATAEVDTLTASASVTAKLDTSKQFTPAAATSTNAYSLGSSSLPWWNLYTGGGTIKLGSATSSKLGFFGTTPIAKQTLSTASQNMSYTSATASNYLVILNNLVGILKNKYGLIG